MTTWLSDDRYRWIREHLAQREDDELLYTPMAAGRAEVEAPWVRDPTWAEWLRQGCPPVEDEPWPTP